MQERRLPPHRHKGRYVRMAVELLRPDGKSRVVVEDEVAVALLALEEPFILIRSDAPDKVNASAAMFGLKPNSASTADVKVEVDNADTSNGAVEATASSRRVGKTGGDNADNEAGEDEQSRDVGAAEAIEEIADMSIEAEVYAYIEGERRISVIKAGNKRAEEIRADEDE